MFTMVSDQVRTGEQMVTITTLWRQLSNQIFMIVDDTPTLALGTCLRWSATKYALVNRWLLLQHCDVNYLIKYSWLLMTHPLWHLEHVYDGQRPITVTGEQMVTITTLWRQLSNEIFMIVDDTPTLALGTCLRWSATKYALVNRWLLLQHCDINYLIKYSWLLMTHPLWHLEHVYDGQRPITHWWTDGYYYNTVTSII